MSRPAPMPCSAVLVRGFPVPHVDTDDFAALFALTGHLVSRGHRRIAYLASSLDFGGSQRLLGYQAALKEADIAMRRDWVRAFTDETFDAEIGFTGYGERAVTAWLREDWDALGCTALLCHNDEIAAGALRALSRAGRRVPHDVAVAGFDGLQLAEHLSPPLTTMQAPLYEIGARGVLRLLQHMRGETPVDEPLEELLPARLISRASTETPHR
jgi:DNA-binding LacI/PurR family transcriptional regulator